jgi:8-oxo-dGTP pyrophosphatase MutT (NUDIX family)/phage portal protein BeeE
VRLWRALLGQQKTQEIARYSIDQYANDLSLAFAGNRYLLSGGSTGWTKTEDLETSFTGYINSLYKSNGIVFAIILARMLLFTEARFCWFDVNDNGEDGRPAGRGGLEVLERPWPNGGTAELLARMEQDVSLGGNFFAVREPNRMRRIRPDWLTIVLTAPPAEAVQSDVAGYWYHPGRTYSDAGEPTRSDEVYLPDEICHWSPIPDPDAQYRGMSWLTPVVREVMADKAARDHKLAFFENGATFGAIISAKESLTNTQYREWKANFEGVHSGASNAYKSLFLASPVDTSVLTANMQQLDFKVTTGAGETRLCAAGGVPPIIVGLSEGLASATYSNYGMARRKFGDHWAHPQWKSASTALTSLVDAPSPDVRLGVNTRGIAFLREDAKDLAEILQIKASTLSTLIMAGYEPKTAAAAVDAEDFSLLKHTGLTSVQLVPPGTEDAAAAEEDEAEYDVLLDELRAAFGGGDDDLIRAVLLGDEDDDEAADDDQGEVERRFNPAQLRHGSGTSLGGQWRSLSSRVMGDLVAWLNAGGTSRDPLAAYSQPQLKTAATQLGLNPHKGMRLTALKIMIVAHARRRHTGSGAVPAGSPLPPGVKKVSARVAGTTGVTSVDLPAQQPPPGSPSWMTPARQSLEIHLGGKAIGSIHLHSYGWRAETPAGNPVIGGRTKTGAIQALIADHQLRAQGAPSTTVAGATLRRGRQVFGSTPDHYEVDYNGVDVGGIHGDESDPSADWTAFPPPGSSYGLQGNPGSGQSYTTRDDAAQGLVDAYNQHLLSQAMGGLVSPTPGSGQPATPPAPRPTAPRITTRRTGTGFYDVQANGVDIGSVSQRVSGDWIANPPAGGGLTGTLTAGPHSTRKAAVDALVAVMPQRAQTAAKTRLTRLPQTYATQVGVTEAHQVSVGATSIGEVRRVPAGWRAFDVNGQQLGSTTSHRQSAVARVLGAHLGTYPAAGSSSSGTTTTPAGAQSLAAHITAIAGSITVRRRPGTTDHEVIVGGYPGGFRIGVVQQVRAGRWQVVPDINSGIAQTQVPGPYGTRNDAAQALAVEYAKANPPGAPTSATPAASASAAPTITTRQIGGRGSGYFMVSANGNDIGAVLNTPAGYTVMAANGVPAPAGGPFKTKTHAVHAIAQAYTASLAPPPAPSPAPAQSVPSAPDPAVKAAHDVIYGVDPKAKTATRQLAVYGALRKSHFDSLDPAEQQTLLGDLQYIATTSQGPNAAKAQTVIHRFTPAGTPVGTIPPQAVIPPAGAASAQTRVADQAGTPGLLKMKPAGQRGRSGDGWTRTTSGGSGPWGQYGAAGLMLRHVDPATGEERFLMIQRGPGISDPGMWQFPGGAKEEKEDFYQGAAREVIEELGFQGSDLDSARVHGTHSHEVPAVMVPGLHGGQVPWAYVSIAATVDSQLVPDLSTAHARAETSDAKWMTRAEIDGLDQQGKLLRPLARGQLQQNVLTLFPPSGGPGATGAAATVRRPPRLKGTPKPKTPHKPSKGKDLIPDQAAQDSLRAHIATVRKSYRGKTADERLASIGAMQGYDDTPTVVSKAEMDRLLATGDYIEAWRGMTGAWGSRGKTAAQIHEEMRSGPAYYGTGVFGNGYYFSTKKSVARQYSDGTKNSILRVLIPKAAKTEVHSKVKRKADASSSSTRSTWGGGRSGDLGGGTLRDEGRYAAAAGLDGIEIPHSAGGGSMSASHIAGPGQPAYVWLNRSVLIVQEADP